MHGCLSHGSSLACVCCVRWSPAGEWLHRGSLTTQPTQGEMRGSGERGRDISWMKAVRYRIVAGQLAIVAPSKLKFATRPEQPFFSKPSSGDLKQFTPRSARGKAKNAGGSWSSGREAVAVPRGNRSPTTGVCGKGPHILCK